MIRRTTLIFFLVSIILAALAFVLIKYPIDNTKDLTPTFTPQPRVIPGFDPANVTKIDIRSETFGNYSLEYLEGSWVIPEQADTAVSQGKVQQLLMAINALSMITIIDQSTPLDIIGLENPLAVIEITSSPGTLNTISFGGSITTNSGYYVRLNSDMPIIASQGEVEEILGILRLDDLIVKTATPTPLSQDFNLTPSN